MGIYTQKSGATAHPEASVLQFITDLLNTSGVLDLSSSNHFIVEQQSVPNMTVKVATGRAYIKDTSGNGYPVRNDASTNVSISANSSGNSRIDALVLYIDKSATPNTDASNVAKLLVVEGTPAGSPSAPDSTAIQSAVGAGNPYTKLAHITVASGATSIATANISDQRTACTFIDKLGADWIQISGTITRASADDPTYVMTIASQNLTGQIGSGMRIKWTQNSIVRYGIVTAISFSTNTTLTILTRCNDANANYDMLDSSTYPVTEVYYSTKYAPVGFDVDKVLWTITSDTASGSQASATNGAWYNLGGNIVVAIGSWKVSMSIMTFAAYKTGVASLGAKATLSTANNSESDDKMSHNNGSQLVSTGGNTYSVDQGAYKENVYKFASKTTLYCNLQSVSNTANVGCSVVRLRAVSQYV